MSIALLIAICTAMNAVGKLLDDFYVPNTAKDHFVDILSRFYRRIDLQRYNRIVSDTANILLASYETTLSPRSKIRSFSFITISYLIRYGINITLDEPIGLQLKRIIILSALFIPPSLIACAALRSIFIKIYMYSLSLYSITLFIFGLISYAVLIFWSMRDGGRFVFFNPNEPKNVQFVEMITSAEINGLVPFIMLSLIMPIIVAIKLVIKLIDYIYYHFMSISAKTHKPFTYTAAVITVILAFLKIYDELRKMQ